MASVLWALLALFILRVAGQLLVGLGAADFLPPWEEWFSGAVGYPWILASQILIVLVLGRVCVDLSRGRGWFAVRRPAFGSVLLGFGGVYAAVMIIRYVIRMALYPPERWTGGALPIFFHLVLASFVLVLGAYHRRATAGQPRVPRAPLWIFARSSIWVIVVAAVLAWTAYQLAPFALARALEVRRAEYAVRIDRGAPMRTSDGVTLRADIYRPHRVEKTPTILVRIPFSKTLANSVFGTVIGRFWAERGYTVVIQGTRGRYESGGRFYPLRHERQDGVETLAWLAQQPWFDGRVGMWGGSAFGHTQWALVDDSPAALSTMMVQICSTDFHRMFYPGGAFALRSALFWAMRSGGAEDVWPGERELDRGAATLPLRGADDAAGADVPFFDDWVRHAERDVYWQTIDGTNRSAKLRAPIHLMAGWFDPFLPGQLADFVRIRSEGAPDVADQSRLVIGPWAHAETVTLPGGLTSRNYRLESLAPSVPWFDRHLRGLHPAADLSGPVRIFVMGANTWREETEWPPARARRVSYYLRSGGRAHGAGGDGGLATQPPSAAEPADVFRFDPADPVPTRGGAMLGPGAGVTPQNDVERRADVLVYTTQPLDADTEVTGDVVVRLHVATTAPATDFTAKLVDVHPDGTAYNVVDGILRRRYTTDANPAQARPTAIDIDLTATSMLFRRGHRIRLQVSSSNFPRFDRNLNTGDTGATGTRMTVATQAVHHGPDAPSHIVLPIVPSGPQEELDD
jgi:putative CocE/NonD family hydrolase